MREVDCLAEHPGALLCEVFAFRAVKDRQRRVCRQAREQHRVHVLGTPDEQLGEVVKEELVLDLWLCWVRTGYEEQIGALAAELFEGRILLGDSCRHPFAARYA